LYIKFFGIVWGRRYI